MMQADGIPVTNATAPNENLEGESFHELYKTYWKENIAQRVIDLDPSVNWSPYFDPVTQTAYPPDFPGIFNVIDNIPTDSLILWHQKQQITQTIAIQIWALSPILK